MTALSAGLVGGRGVGRRREHAAGPLLAGLDLDRTVEREPGRQVFDQDPHRPIEALASA